MHKKSIIIRWLIVFAAVAFFAGCSGMAVKPDQQNFQAPEVSLDSMEVAHAFGFWYFSNKVQPTKGKPDNVGAPLDLAFIFNIKNKCKIKRCANVVRLSFSRLDLVGKIPKSKSMGNFH